MIEDPVKKQEDKIRYDYLKKELTFEDFRKQRQQDKRNQIILAGVLVFFIWTSFTVAFMYATISESRENWKEISLEMAKGVCEEMGEDFINLKVREFPDGTKRANLICSNVIKLYSLNN